MASPKGAQTPRGITAPPTQAATPLNNHVSAPMDESAKLLHANEELPADHVEAMDTREGKLIQIFLLIVNVFFSHGPAVTAIIFQNWVPIYIIAATLNCFKTA